MFRHTTLRSLRWLFAASAAVMFMGSCANQNQLAGDDPYGTGPFDADGNYREDWADDPTKWRRPGSRQKPQQEPLFAANDQPPSNATPLPPANTAPKTYTPPKPKPKPVASKPKPKPQPVRYTVKKGDSLYVIARRNGTTVSALQRANGISGSLIHPGQRLVIPK